MSIHQIAAGLTIGAAIRLLYGVGLNLRAIVKRIAEGRGTRQSGGARQRLPRLHGV
ncbi:hypothetical protein [Caulobacter sp. S45]|uniref:hypothetical protein n=1 Tax=Caulobacter sp. S45 TaxID=1641861 RepID=UPI00157752D5|nr:hypothetical protein [Caulobacter sp. S45]